MTTKQTAFAAAPPGIRGRPEEEGEIGPADLPETSHVRCSENAVSIAGNCAALARRALGKSQHLQATEAEQSHRMILGEGEHEVTWRDELRIARSSITHADRTARHHHEIW